jgi:transposase, IS6 family
MVEQHPFKWRHFHPDIILLCVRWYLRYALSY